MSSSSFLFFSCSSIAGVVASSRSMKGMIKTCEDVHVRKDLLRQTMMPTTTGTSLKTRDSLLGIATPSYGDTKNNVVPSSPSLAPFIRDHSRCKNLLPSSFSPSPFDTRNSIERKIESRGHLSHREGQRSGVYTLEKTGTAALIIPPPSHQPFSSGVYIHPNFSSLCLSSQHPLNTWERYYAPCLPPKSTTATRAASGVHPK